MGANSSIEWTDHTFNPWMGCTKVSPGCLHCYAEALSLRTGRGAYKKGVPRVRTSPENWEKVRTWNRRAAQGQQEWAALAKAWAEMAAVPPPRPRVFCASLADWLDEEVPIAWLADLLQLIHETPQLDWLLLSKRPGNFFERVSAAQTFLAKEPGAQNHGELILWLDQWLADYPAPSNVWIGVTVEDQVRAEERIPRLLEIPARVRFLSCEPLLGSVHLLGKTKTLPYEFDATGLAWSNSNLRYERLKPAGIHWVIGGGESGGGARITQERDLLMLRNDCGLAGIKFFFKQWGEWRPRSSGIYERVGKKAAGRVLDGRTWDEVPSPSATGCNPVPPSGPEPSPSPAYRPGLQN